MSSAQGHAVGKDGLDLGEATGTDAGIHRDALEHVTLRVAAAHGRDVGPRRAEPVEGAP